MAGQFLKAAANSSRPHRSDRPVRSPVENVIEMIKLTKRQIEVTMFASGVGALEGLKAGKLVEHSKVV